MPLVREKSKEEKIVIVLSGKKLLQITSVKSAFNYYLERLITLQVGGGQNFRNCAKKA